MFCKRLLTPQNLKVEQCISLTQILNICYLDVISRLLVLIYVLLFIFYYKYLFL